MPTCKILRSVYVAAAAAILVATPAAALVRLGAGAGAGFAFPAASFDHDAKAAVCGNARLYGNVFHWLTLEGGADFHLPFAAESNDGTGETRLVTYKAGFIYKIHMGIFKPFLALGYAQFDERIKREDGWENISAPGFYIVPGLEYFFSERFSAYGMLGYDRAFDDGRDFDRDTQYLRLDFGVNYSYW